MARMIADAKFKHEGRWLKSGDEFETDIENAHDLVALSMAHFKPSTLQDLAEDVTAIPPPPELAEETISAPRRGSYRRRDIKAES